MANVTTTFFPSTTNFLSTNLFTEGYASSDDSMWGYEINGWNVMFLTGCSLVLFICCCSICIVVAYNNHHSKTNNSKSSSMSSSINFGRRSSLDMQSSFKTSTKYLAEDLDNDHDVVLKNFPSIDSHDSIEIVVQKLNMKYRNTVKLPFYYYIIKFIHYLSILIEYILVIYYININKYDYVLIFYIFWIYSVLMTCCNLYSFSNLFCELTQTIILLMLCNWDVFAFIIFISIFLFQITSRCITGILNGDACDFAECRKDKTEIETEKCGSSIGESLRIALFSNLEAIPLLYYNKNTIFITKYYMFLLIFNIWISSISPDYIKYLSKFGQFFQPKKHFNHFIASLYHRIQIISGIVFKLFNIYFCVLYLLDITTNDDNYSKFEYAYSLFFISFSFLLLIGLTTFLLLNRKQCCCGGIKGCCKWFWCLTIEYKYLL